MSVEPVKGKNSKWGCFFRGCYFNRDDPRVWVYRDEKCKAVGVTLNFAKTAAWVWLALLIGSLFVCQWGAKWIFRDCFTSYDQTAREMICGLLIGSFAVWCPLMLITCFGLAARDLKRHPGPQAERPQLCSL